MKKKSKSRPELDRDSPDMDDLGEDYLAAAVIKLIQNDGRIRSAILDLMWDYLRS